MSARSWKDAVSDRVFIEIIEFIGYEKGPRILMPRNKNHSHEQYKPKNNSDYSEYED